jgi:PAS domain S-box-containing protein
MSIIMRNRATRLGVLIWCSCVLFASAASAASADGDGQALTNGGQIRMLFVAAIPWHYPVEDAATIVVVMTLIAAVTILWVALLRRQVSEQTRRLRERLERETALERQYREIFDGASDMIFTHDLERRFTSLNPAACCVLGYSAEEAKQLTIDQVLAPEYHDHGRQLRATKLPAGEVVTCQGAFITKDGRRVMVETSLRMMFKDGKPLAVHGIARDITERKRIEERYRTIIGTAPDGFWLADMQGRFLDVNDAYCNLIGYSREELLSMSIPDIEAAEKPGETAARIRKIMQVGGDRFETHHRCKDGRIVDIEVSVNYLKDEERMSVFLRDVTGRKQAAEALKESQIRYRQLVDKTDMGFVVIDHKGIVIEANEPYMHLIGAEKMEEIIGHSVIEWTAPEARDSNTAAVALCSRQGYIKDFETIYLHRDGTRVDIIINATVRETPVGKCLISFCRDVTERKQAEVTLRESRALYHSLVEQLPANIYRKDDQGRFIYVNSRFCQFQGRPAEELLGKTVFDLVHKDLAEQYTKEDQMIRETGQTVEHEEERQDLGEKTLYFHVVKSPVFNSDGKIVGTQGMFQDVTARKQADAALAYERDLLCTLLDNSPDCIYFKDRQSRFVQCSKAFEELFQVSDRSRFIGKTDFDFFTEEHARPAYEDEQEIIRTGQPLLGKVEKETHPDGRATWCLTNKLPWRDKGGNIIGTFGISKSVTALKEAEDKLASERDLLRTLLDNFPDAIYYKDRQSRFVRLSKSTVEKSLAAARSRHCGSQPSADPAELPAHLAGVEQFAEYMLGKTDFDFFAESHARPAYEDEQEIIRTGKPILGKLEEETHPDGRITWCLTTKMPWCDKDGNIIGTFGISKDFTALKKAEVELEAAHQRLIETSRLAGMAEVATDVLHNVGNILNSVNVSCSLAVDRVKASNAASLSKVSAMLEENRGRLGEFLVNDPRGQRIPGFLAALAEHFTSEQSALLQELEQLRENVEHIKQIVAMQQSYAKVAGVMESVSAAQLVEDALHINGAALARHTVQVRREFEETPPIVTDKHRVLQILVNLIHNAKYALDDSGRPDRLMTLRVGGDGDGHVKIQVSDNGIGIPPENLTRIFGHGFTTRHNGHGFGLHSGALAVRELGGSIQAQSEGLGKGATFTLLLPHNRPAQPI